MICTTFINYFKINQTIFRTFLQKLRCRYLNFGFLFKAFFSTNVNNFIIKKFMQPCSPLCARCAKLTTLYSPQNSPHRSARRVVIIASHRINHQM